MHKNILVVKETRAGETRVALVPKDVKKLLAQGYQVWLERGAGEAAGFPDQAYRAAGAKIRANAENTVAAYQKLFADMAIILRVKRPLRSREILENQAIAADTVMIGALDPLERDSGHWAEYQHAGIIAHSIDQVNLASDDPRNILASMSRIAGKLAVLDALDKLEIPARKVIVIGFGALGRAAVQEAVRHGLVVKVVLTNPTQVQTVIRLGGQALLLDDRQSLAEQQQQICPAVIDAEIVIASARRLNQPAPLLLPRRTLLQMQRGVVVVDLALSEGGNVEGSAHDVTQALENGVIVTNTSGYPKAVPREASQLWSAGSVLWLSALFE